ncbi:MAG: AMP-binding protein [Parvularculaceae bacterium]
MANAATSNADRAVAPVGDVSGAFAVDAEGLERVIRSLIADELASARGLRSLQVESLDWEADAPLKEGGLELDSLELYDAAARVNQFFRMHEAGIEDYLLLEPTIARWVEVVTKSLEMKFERLSFMTSGSTGASKTCTHEFSDLVRDAVFIGDLVAPARVVTLVPPHHIYGFIYGVLTPIAAGVSVIDARATSPGALRAALRPGDLIVATPFLFRHLLRAMERFPVGVVGLCSTSPLTDERGAALGAAGLHRIYEVYGSSETCGVGWRRVGDAAFRAFPWRRVVAEGDGAVVEAGRPRASTMDALDVNEAAQTFKVVARRDGAVQIGGTNVFPDAVAATLRRAPGVREAAVRVVNAEDGARARLKAFVTPQPGVSPEDAKRAAAAQCTDELPAPARPSVIDVGDALPRNEVGKLADW